MVSDLDKLLDSLPKYPNFMVMHFGEESRIIERMQKNFRSSDIDEYLLATLNKEKVDSLSSYENSFTKVKFIPPQKPRYQTNAKMYDYLFVTTLPEDM